MVEEVTESIAHDDIAVERLSNACVSLLPNSWRPDGISQPVQAA
jgi:hypothetical protein